MLHLTFALLRYPRRAHPNNENKVAYCVPLLGKQVVRNQPTACFATALSRAAYDILGSTCIILRVVTLHRVPLLLCAFYSLAEMFCLVAWIPLFTCLRWPWSDTNFLMWDLYE